MPPLTNLAKRVLSTCPIKIWKLATNIFRLFYQSTWSPNNDNYANSRYFFLLSDHFFRCFGYFGDFSIFINWQFHTEILKYLRAAEWARKFVNYWNHGINYYGSADTSTIYFLWIRWSICRKLVSIVVLLFDWRKHIKNQFNSNQIWGFLLVWRFMTC